MKPIIGIVGRPHTSHTGKEVMCVLDDYRKAISNCGGIPIIICPTQNMSYEKTTPKLARQLNEKEREDLIVQINLCDGLIFPGGNRIYDYDYFICDYTLKNNINILGICMGAQIIAAIDCNKLARNILKKIESDINHNQLKSNYVHKVKIDKNSKLYEIVQKEILEVNSRHKQVITETKNFKIVAKSEDGFIEAIENMNGAFRLGLQWHPESMESYDKSMKKIIEYFIKECKKDNYKNNRR